MASPEFVAALDAIRANPSAFPDDLASARAAIDQFMGAMPLAAGTAVEAVTVVGRPARWVRPATGNATEPARAVLYLHGGGFRIGSTTAYQGFVSQMVAAAGRPFLALDYRLAPEHPFPAAVDDCVAAYRWLLESGFAAERIAVAGDSAGGGLVVSTLLGAQLARLPQPAAAVGLSPWVDLTVTAASYVRCADSDPFFGLAQARQGASDYLAGGDPYQPLASPVFASAEALRALAPLLVHASACEVLADDASTLAARIQAAGGTVQLDLWPDMVHVWHSMAPHVPESRQAVDEVADFLRTHLR